MSGPRLISHQDAQNQQHGANGKYFIAWDIPLLIINKIRYRLFDVRKNAFSHNCASLCFFYLSAFSVFPCSIKSISQRLVVHQSAHRLSIRKRSFQIRIGFIGIVLGASPGHDSVTPAAFIRRYSGTVSPPDKCALAVPLEVYDFA